MNISIDVTQKKISSFLEFLQVEDSTAKLFLLESAVNEYKQLRDSKNELYNKNESLEANIQKLKNSMESSRELFQLKDRIDLELRKYDDAFNGSDQKVAQIKNKRFELINNLLTKIQNILTDTSSEDKSEKDNTNSMYGMFMLFPLPFVVVISTLLFLKTSQTEHIILGSTIFVLNLALFVLVNVYSEVRIFNTKLFSIDYNNPNTNIYQQFVKKLSNRENEFLVNAAWVSALRTEKNKIIETIEHRMGGKSFIEVEGELKKLQEEIDSNASAINTKLDSLIDAEEYLKIRRELDLLKIDNPNLQALEMPNIVIKGLDNLEQSIKGSIMSYIEYLKQSNLATVVLE
ncbi:hypothetical protein KC678_04920 [Candidatus Dojkabacteria bacterium]|uniref:Uncharacterized protein n=1 Tax=Candidatus Dojkabacteria bacterium TaxID=2099670 RepID=A0A955RGY6_9BACT|nr:hypothetical protein [Candidatus Dojkabacteria bacterium]